MVLAVDFLLENPGRQTLAEHTKERLQPLLTTFHGFKPAELKAKRRAVLQRLLNIDASREEDPQENPEFCTRLTIVAGEQFLAKQQQLSTRK
jgi:hypothetical protein